MRLTEITMTTAITQKDTYNDLVSSWKRTSKVYGKTAYGTMGKYQVIKSVTDAETLLAMYDGNAIALVVRLISPFSNEHTMLVDLVAVNPEYAGMNLPVVFYTWLVKSKNIILMSGMGQTRGGRSIWERFIKVPGIHFYQYDIRNKQMTPLDSDIDNDDIWDDQFNDEIDYLQGDESSEDELQNVRNAKLDSAYTTLVAMKG